MKGKTTIDYCPMDDMPADLLMKALPHVKLQHLCNMLHLGILDITQD